MQKDLIVHRGATLGSILRNEGCTEELGSHIDAIFGIFAKQSGIVLDKAPVPATDCKIANMSMHQIRLTNRLLRKLLFHVSPPKGVYEYRFDSLFMPVGGALVRELLIKSGMHDLDEVEATLMGGERCQRAIINKHIRRELICHNAPPEMMWLAQVNQAFYTRLGMGLCDVLVVDYGMPMMADATALPGLMFDTPAATPEAQKLKMKDVRERIPDFGKPEVERLLMGVQQCKEAHSAMENLVSDYLHATESGPEFNSRHYLVKTDEPRVLMDSQYAEYFAKKMSK